jgi:2-polyprenyl-6-methoxyphenol hydroxylase-like FAD-dependent oxidoreductase
VAGRACALRRGRWDTPQSLTLSAAQLCARERLTDTRVPSTSPASNPTMTSTANPSELQVVIAGAGPAGMMLAYQLASNGIPVRVLERHDNFEREFRGELVMPSALGILERIHVLQALVVHGDARRDVERELYVGLTRRVVPPGGRQIGAWVSQPALLRLLHQACGRFPHYRMDFGTAVRAIERNEGGRIAAFITRQSGMDVRVSGDVFVISTGRGNAVREQLGVSAPPDRTPADVLWLSLDFSDAPGLLPAAVRVHMFGRGRVLVNFAAARSRLHIAFSSPENITDLRREPARLRAELLPMITTDLRAAVSARLEDTARSQILRVSVDHLDSWHAAGAMFIGDAAHTMSPMAGQGLNAAIRDSVVLANHLIETVRRGAPIEDHLFESVERERRPEIEALQSAGRRVSRIVMAPVAVEHLMFTVLGLFLRLHAPRREPDGGPDPLRMRYPVSITSA